jgi:predicted RNA polymerase sigma factor
VGGLTTAQIAAAFLVPEATMAQRISRAKQSIRASGVPFARPEGAEGAERLRAVLHVLYLIFNEGYAATTGPDLTAPGLSDEAIRLTRWLRQLLPDDSEVAGLLALMLLTDARRAARTRPDGSLVPLSEQDRGTWDRQRIAEGVALVTEALPNGPVGPYQLQAAIAALHAAAGSFDATDWPQIALLYRALARVDPSPVVEVNRAVAVGMADGPLAGLAVLAPVLASGALAEYGPLHAAHGFLLEKAGDSERARGAWMRATETLDNAAVRDELLRRYVEPLTENPGRGVENGGSAP